MIRLVYYRVKKILKDTCININFIEQDSRFILCFTILGLLDIEQLEYLKQYGTCILFYNIAWQNNQLSLSNCEKDMYNYANLSYFPLLITKLGA
jgi:hypothetical protein